MNQFVKDFEPIEVETRTVQNVQDCKLIIHHKDTSSITVLLQNIRSITKNFDEISIMLEQFENIIDIIVLTQTGRYLTINHIISVVMT